MKGNNLLGSCDVFRLQDENLRDNLQEQMNTPQESVRYDNVEDG